MRCTAIPTAIELRLEGPVDPDTGFVVDFFEIERVFQPVLAQLDHAYLNEIAGLDNPTAELIARWIWQRIKAELPLLAAGRLLRDAELLGGVRRRRDLTDDSRARLSRRSPWRSAPRRPGRCRG